MLSPASGDARDADISARPLPSLLTHVLQSCPHRERALSEAGLFVPAYLRWELVRRQRAEDVVSMPFSLTTGFKGNYAGFGMTPPEIVGSLSTYVVASLRAAKILGECVDHYFRLLEGKQLNLDELSHLSAILGATMGRLRALKYAKSPSEQASNEAFHAQTTALATHHVYQMDYKLERCDFLPHPNPNLEAVAPLLHGIGLSEEYLRGYYFLLLLGKVGNPVLRAALREW